MLSVPQTFVHQCIGEILLGRKVAGEVVRILIAIVIPQLLHQFCRRITDGQRHRLVACAPHEFKGSVHTEIGTVALRRGGQIDRRLCQWDAAFGPADLHHGVEGGIGQQQGVGIGQSDILCGTDHETAGDELRVFPTLDHACQPVERSVGVRAADALDEGRDDIIVHLPVLIVGQRILLQPIHHQFIGDSDFVRHFSLDHQLQDIQ